MPKQLKPKGQAAPPPAPDFVATSDSVKAQAIKLAAQQAQLTAAFKPKAGTLYIRNIRNIGCRVTLDTGRRIDLAPRGQIDDIAPVSKNEQADSKFIINAGLLFEIISVKDAAEVIRKQAVNAQAPRRNPLLDHLLNERGESYDMEEVHLEPSAEEQAIVAARITTAPDGKNTTGNTEILREAMAPKEVAVPGSRLNPGPQVPSDISAEDVREFLAWKEAQQLQALRDSAVVEDTQTEADSGK